MTMTRIYGSLVVCVTKKKAYRSTLLTQKPAIRLLCSIRVPKRGLIISHGAQTGYG